MDGNTCKPLVSVLMCVYNTKEEYLREAIRSILEQDYENIEFIIVNDGSSDDETLACLREIGKLDVGNKIIIINQTPNIGLTKALNVGLKKCTGKYVARMDADDVSVLNRISLQVEYMEAHPDVALSGGAIQIFDGNVPEEYEKERAGDNRLYDKRLYDISSLIIHSGPAHPTFMLRKSFLDENHISYREEIRCAQDYGIMVDILKNDGAIRELRNILLFYRVHAGQITNINSSKQIYFQEQISREYLQYRFRSLTEDESGILAKIKQPGYAAKSSVYIHAMKKIFKENRVNLYYDQYLLEREFKYIWVNKVITSAKKRIRPWMLFSPYTIGCIKLYREYKKKKGYI